MPWVSYQTITATLIILLVVLGMMFFPNYSTDTTFTYHHYTGYNEEKNEETNNTSAIEGTYSPVFCEFASATTCKYCPNMGEIIYSIYDENKYPLSVVSLVYDKNSKAKKRLTEDYNITGFPTVFLNGGEKVIYGSDYTKSKVENIIASLAQQNKPDISINLSVSIDENASRIYTNVHVTNNESTRYSGTLKVYLTEINSRWYDYDGKPYRFAFLDYLLDDSVSLSPGGSGNFTSEWDYSAFSPVDRNNLLVTAVIFSNKTEVAFSNPPDNINGFTAHPVDALAVQRISKGNLPPKVGISLPKEGKFHFRSKPLFWTVFGKTWIVGKTDVTVLVSDDGNYIKLEFYIDNTLKHTVTDTGKMDDREYTFTLRGPLFGRHVLTVRAYDKEGKQSETKLPLKTIIFFP